MKRHDSEKNSGRIISSFRGADLFSSLNHLMGSAPICRKNAAEHAHMSGGLKADSKYRAGNGMQVDAA